MEYDAVNAYDLAYCEIRQRRESGHEVGDAERQLAAIDPSDRAALLALHDSLADAPTLAGWRYVEPSDLAGITATLPEPAAPRPVDRLDERIHGGWLGRVVGCNLGKPVEDGVRWNAAKLQDYLTRAGAYPLRDYVPVLEPMPDGFELHWTWPETTLGRVDGSARDDDIDYAILNLLLLERHGRALTTSDVARAWLELLPFRQVFTAERVAYRNLVDGLPAEQVPTFRNPYREWIGAQIRGDAFGWTNPGDPRSAALAAYTDARLSHVANGIYGEMWSAALVAAAFTADSARAAVAESLRHLPPRSRLAEAVGLVLARHEGRRSWESTVAWIEHTYGEYLWVHTIPNAAIVTAGLLWGDGDFAATVGLTVQAGLDTDSNGATAGSVAGVLLGPSAIPAHFAEPIHDTVRTGLFGLRDQSISDLARRTAELARRPR